MKPFQLLIQPTPDGTRIHCQWFGQSARLPAGALTLPRTPEAEQSALPDRFAIDLAPLLARVATQSIANAAGLADSDELLPLRDLLGPDGLAGVCGALHPLLWRASRTATPV
jgi:hypothetical protein